MLNRKLKKFLFRYTDKKSIDKKTIIDSNLLIKGTEITSFVKNFSQEFKVDISNFDCSDYCFNASSNTEGQKPLTIGDLNKAISLGRLDKYTIASEEFEAKFRPDITLRSVLIGIVIAIITTIFLCIVSFFF